MVSCVGGGGGGGVECFDLMLSCLLFWFGFWVLLFFVFFVLSKSTRGAIAKWRRTRVGFGCNVNRVKIGFIHVASV